MKNEYDKLIAFGFISLAFIAGAIAFFTREASAQQVQPVQSEYVFRLTIQEVDVIGKALGTQPYNDVVGLINKLRQQYVEQQVKPELKKE